MDVSGPTMTCLRGQEGSLIGQLYRKRFFGYSGYTYAFSPSNCHLYQFRNELVSLICPARPFIPKGDWEDGGGGGGGGFFCTYRDGRLKMARLYSKDELALRSVVRWNWVVP